MTQETAGEIKILKAGLISHDDDEDILLRIHANADFFANGEQGILKWNTQKQDVIIEMANDISFLISKKHPKFLGKTNHDISGLVCDMLKEHNCIDESTFSWVRKTLSPLGFTNPKFANTSVHLGIGESVSNKKFTYISKEEMHAIFAKMSTEEQVKFYNAILASDTERKRQIKLTKDNAKLWFETHGVDPQTYSIKSNKYDPAYDDAYDDSDDEPTPPEELRQFHKFSDVIAEWADDIARLQKIVAGIQEKAILFPPQNAELDEACAKMATLTKRYIWEKLIGFFSGFNDDKAVSTWDGWCDYLQHKAIHGNNAAASKFATPTGEFQEVKRNDGTTFLQVLKRKVTNEHLKKKMPEQVKEIKEFWLFEFIFGAMRKWYKEQYYVVGGSDLDNAEVEREYKEAQA